MQCSDKRIAIIGECMLEVSSIFKSNGTNNSNDAVINYGGDTINTSIYLARLGIEVSYASALGDDSISRWLLNEWQSEKVNCELVTTIAGKLPGLYMIENNADGERYFHYWRENSAAKNLFTDSLALNQLFESLKAYQWLYLSGITLALFSDSTRTELYDFIKSYRAQGGRVIFDSNYRPQLWASKQITRVNYQMMYSLTDIALPTLEDELELFDETSAEQVADRITGYNVKEIVIKMGHQGCMIINDEQSELVVAIKVNAIDTTAAGDSFNAGYLSSRLSGQSQTESAMEGHKLASRVVQHKGAIIPIDSITS